MRLSKLGVDLLSSLVLGLLITNLYCLADQGEEILRSAVNAPFHMDFEGIMESVFYTPTKTYTFKTKIIYQKSNFIYIEYLEPAWIKGKIIIDNGKERIEYTPVNNKMDKLPSFVSPKIEKIKQKALEVMLNNFEISRLSREVMRGREVYVISLNPRYSIGPLLKLWIDRKTYLPLKKEKYKPDGRLSSLLCYVEAKFGEHFPREIFYSKLPKIAANEKIEQDLFYYSREEIKKRANFPLSFPAYLPPGYIFQGGEIIEKERTVKLIYTDGLEVIILFQRPHTDILMRKNQWIKWGNLRVRFKESPRGKVFTWNKDKKTFVLIGELPLEEFVKIIQSIK